MADASSLSRRRHDSIPGREVLTSRQTTGGVEFSKSCRFPSYDGAVRRLTLAAVVAAALVIAACGSVAAQPQTLTLAYSKGDHYRYSFHLTSNNKLDMGAMAKASANISIGVDMTGNETATVKSVDSSGVADMGLVLSNLKVKWSYSDGKTSTTTTTTGQSMPEVDLKLGPDGRVVSINGTDVSGSFMFGVGANLVYAVLPDSAVKPGDTWSKNYDQANPYGTGAVHVTAKSKYLRNETLKGVNAAVVQTTSTRTYDLTFDFSKMPMPGPPGAIGPPATNGTNYPATSPKPGGATPGAPMGGMTLKGTITSDVTSWIDPSGHRVLKTLMTGTDDISITSTPGPVAAGQAQGSQTFSSKGTQNLDLEPA